LCPTPHTFSSSEKREIYTASLPKIKEKNNKEMKCKMAPLPFTFRNSC